MGEVVFGAIMPHPPILVPEIGGTRLKEALVSQNGVAEVADRLSRQQFDTLIIITPHGKVGRSAVPVYTGHVFEGNFGNFGSPKPLYRFKGDPELARAVVKGSGFASSCVETFLDHGALVPLYYCQQAGIKTPVLPLAIAFLPLPKLFEFGQSLVQIVKASDRKVAIIASADMSHRLTQDAPSGYSPQGKIFDDKLVELVKANDVKGILNFNEELAEEAGQDALWSIAMMLGMLEGSPFSPEVLSYEGPFGVGYMSAVYKPS